MDVFSIIQPFSNNSLILDFIDNVSFDEDDTYVITANGTDPDHGKPYVHGAW